jgi:hypothetical protein
MITLGITTAAFGTQAAYATHISLIIERKAPTSITGDYVYIAWWTTTPQITMKR